MKTLSSQCLTFTEQLLAAARVAAALHPHDDARIREAKEKLAATNHETEQALHTFRRYFAKT